MPAPIAISQTQSHLDSFGAPRSSDMTSGVSASNVPYPTPGSASYREAMALSFGKDVADVMDYSIASFSTSTDSTASDATALPSTSVSRKLDTTFCRNFTCCGKALDDLHDLLQHYEERHVRCQDDDLPSMTSDDDYSSQSSASQPPSPRSSCHHDADDTSAFDIAVMRSPFQAKGKKRSFGQYSSSHNPTHQSLRRALIDGGIGRRQPQIYTANSPFSTPDSSVPGTPIGESEADAAFVGGMTPSFSSMSIRNGFHDDHNLPSCAPPNLFFPSGGSASQSGHVQPPMKRERVDSMGGSISSSTARVMADAMSEGELNGAGGVFVEKPFKCQMPGCDKAYKQANGLKYHRLHGTCNQNLLPLNQQSINGSHPNSRASTPSARTAMNPDGTLCDGSTPPSPSSAAAMEIAASRMEKRYVCQVGACGKHFGSISGLKYHYTHSGSHGLLGMALLSANGGGASARIETSTGRPLVNTSTLTSEQLAAAAQAALAAQTAQQNAAQAKAMATPQTSPTASPAPIISTSPKTSPAQASPTLASATSVLASSSPATMASTLAPAPSTETV
ncbi:hypothetical protein IE81DRAFT_115507 [Ceraceosorus guamensis]|uniref:C2H2-type domain-containing protein n=1 Tax=Ceraceosorus guamensis TaxID=1522189 RepID=A0A316VZT9_9BASI|nr:hypothetical protein IE81DRAFT_115507 [Ceraceosorus guamensis]PWN42784.1 hypothetical protein IE81DRAFT_115507 [Ceraceosorus guamensis]